MATQILESHLAGQPSALIVGGMWDGHVARVFPSHVNGEFIARLVTPEGAAEVSFPSFPEAVAACMGFAAKNARL